MERRKPAPPSSSSDESSSNEEEGSEQGFVRSDRKTTKMDDKKGQKPVAAEEEEDDDDEEEEDDDDDDGGVDGTQRGTARDNREAASSSDTTQAGDGHGDSNPGSETSTASEGKPGKPSHQFVVIPRKAENVNGHSKKTEKPPKVRPSSETSPKKSKDKASKRDRDAEPKERGSSKKQKKESSNKPSKSEKVSKEKTTPSHTTEKKSDTRKSSNAAAVSEDPKFALPQQNSSKKPDNTSAKKAAEKSRSDRKATNDAEPGPLKESVSPSKPKPFTPKDELVLTTEILHDIEQGIGIPVKKVDGYWSTLLDRVKGRMEGAWSKEQLCDKVKRMKVRYTSMAEKFKDSAECKFRNSSDKELFGLWDQIWGSGDPMNVDHESEVAEVKDKQPKVSAAASPVKAGKSSRNKGVAPIPDVKIAHEELEGPKRKQAGKESNDDDDDSENEESDGEDSHKKPTILMEVDHKEVPSDRALIPKVNAAQVHEDKAQSPSTSDAQKLFQEEVRATLLELKEVSKQALQEWQSKALVVIENAMRAAADQSRLMNAVGVTGFDGLSNPLRGLSLMGSETTEGNQALQKQWHELRLRELDVYRQRLELMQKECELKQDQLKLQLRTNK